MNLPKVVFKRLGFAIADHSLPAPHPEVTGEIKVDELGIGIRFDGFGTFDMVGDAGTPIYIEFRDAELRVYIWRDINDPEPVKIILNGARVTHQEGG